jgi:hypothetical protein
MVIVEVLPGATGLGLNEAVAPAGRLLIESVTRSLNPPVAAVLISVA